MARLSAISWGGKQTRWTIAPTRRVAAPTCIFLRCCGAISELKLDVALALALATACLSMSVDALSRRLRATLRISELPVRLSAERAISPMESEAASSLDSAWRNSRALGAKPVDELH